MGFVDCAGFSSESGVVAGFDMDLDTLPSFAGVLGGTGEACAEFPEGKDDSPNPTSFGFATSAQNSAN